MLKDAAIAPIKEVVGGYLHKGGIWRWAACANFFEVTIGAGGRGAIYSASKCARSMLFNAMHYACTGYTLMPTLHVSLEAVVRIWYEFKSMCSNVVERWYEVAET